MSRRALGRGRLLVALGAILSLAGMIPAWWTLARTNATGLSGNGLEGVGIVVFLAAKACGTINDSTYRGATLVEILHTATLVHDDVVDDSDMRRGLASIKAVWKNKVAVLMVRPRGWHLEEKHVWIDGSPVAGAIFDFALFYR